MEEDDLVLQDLYAWIDTIPLSKPKKDLKRDFSDGVLAAEIVKHFIPQFVEIHNYTPALSASNKISNWNTLNRKVLSKLGCSLDDAAIRSIVNCCTGAVENFLIILRNQINSFIGQRTANQDLAFNHRVEADQGYYLLNQQQLQTQQLLPQQLQAQQLLPAQLQAQQLQVQQLQAQQLQSQQLQVQQQLQRQQLQAQQLQAQQLQAQQLQAHQLGKARGQKGSNDDHLSLSYHRKFYAAKKEAEQQKNLSTNQNRFPPVSQIQAPPPAADDRDETIELLQNKVKRLEHLVQLKDIRIEDLQTRLSNLDSSHRSKLPVPKGRAKAND